MSFSVSSVFVQRLMYTYLMYVVRETHKSADIYYLRDTRDTYLTFRLLKETQETPIKHFDYRDYCNMGYSSPCHKVSSSDLSSLCHRELGQQLQFFEQNWSLKITFVEQQWWFRSHEFKTYVYFGSSTVLMKHE